MCSKNYFIQKRRRSFIKGTILRDIGSYKKNIITEFQNSKEICDLLFNNASYTESDVKNLLYNRIFPYLYADETQTDVLSFIGVETDIPKAPTNTVKDIKVTIWAYCHRELLQYEKQGFSGTRVDILSDMIEQKLSETETFGIGKLKLDTSNHFTPNKNYYGRELVFYMPCFKIGR